MSEFMSSGYISVDDALEHIGREKFASEWTGQERRARPGLIGIDEWLRIKDLAPARGSGDPDGAPSRKSATRPNAKSPHSSVARSVPESVSCPFNWAFRIRFSAAKYSFPQEQLLVHHTGSCSRASAALTIWSLQLAKLCSWAALQHIDGARPG